ncbi:Flagellar assembly protein FliH [hydrothermal vent metagenome]|uniref:Flagellar assembly protein FliH n=1 Tax=hydrothermal vent metagenome TaxID=652676 RepID=A0A1W1D4P6_9ZZZZ
MSVVISADELERHNVNKYKFKVIALGSEKAQEEKKPTKVTPHTFESLDEKKEQTQEEKQVIKSDESVDSSAMSQDSKNALIESLMKKTEDMSSNFIKLQMKLEAKEEEFEIALQKAKEEAYAKGLEEGQKQIQESLSQTHQESLEKCMNSIENLEKSAKEFESALENIKNDLMVAALDIAKEVVQVELSTSSNEIATLLAQNLIQELQSASHITLKVNPKNHGEISEKLGNMEHIKIVSDSAVSEGGVIVMSDAGNIDAQVSKRFEEVKKVVLSE